MWTETYKQRNLRQGNLQEIYHDQLGKKTTQ